MKTQCSAHATAVAIAAAAAIFAAFGFAPAAFADSTTTQSYTGTLASPDNAPGTFDSTDAFILDVTLSSASNVTLQSYGFGGGVNAAGTTILPGGTDPFVGLFSGTGSGALFIGGTSEPLTNYTPGCPPAGNVGGFGCGDVALTFDDLPVGMYTVLLSDGQFIPCAAISAGCPTNTLADGAFDLTAGVFCNTAGCPNSSGAWALDVTESPVTTAVPEPASLALLGIGLLVAAGLLRRRMWT